MICQRIEFGTKGYRLVFQVGMKLYVILTRHLTCEIYVNANEDDFISKTIGCDSQSETFSLEILNLYTKCIQSKHNDFSWQ